MDDLDLDGQAELALPVKRLAPTDPAVAETVAFAPRSVKVIFTPITAGTLVTVVTTEWQGALRMDQRVMAGRLGEVTRPDWAIAPHDALTRAVRALAVYLET